MIRRLLKVIRKLEHRNMAKEGFDDDDIEAFFEIWRVIIILEAFHRNMANHHRDMANRHPNTDLQINTEARALLERMK